MSLTEVVDQLTYSFIFIITPLQIVSTKSIKNLRKSLLLKLGDKTSKTSQMNKAIEIPLQVMYSRTLKKYSPIKGIIKVYDINQDGSEVISSVGGFQTEEILNQQKTSTVIEKNIGTSKVKMRIQVKNLGIVDHKHHKEQKQSKQMQLTFSRCNKISERNVSNLTSTKNSTILTIKNVNYSEQVEDKNKLDNAGNHYFKRSANLNISPALQTPKFITHPKKDSTDSVSSNVSTNGLRQNVSSRSVLRIGNQTRQQINKNQQKKIDSQWDLNNQRKQIQEYKKQRQETLYQFSRFKECFQSKNSRIWIEFNEKLKTLSWKYKNKHFEKIFDQFFSFILKELQNNPTSQQVSSNFFQCETEANSPVCNNNIVTMRQSDNFSLLTLQQHNSSLEGRLKQKQQQCQQLSIRIGQLQSLRITLHNQNSYIRQKDITLQQIISQKQSQIDNLRQQITQIQIDFKQLQSTLQNDTCLIEQLKQQVSNLTQTIQTYRERYGDLKNVKNRALENQLKECLMWIDQQSRELEMSDFEEQTDTGGSINVSQIIKNIQLEGTSREEMNCIKQELAGLIRRIDCFLAK